MDAKEFTYERKYSSLDLSKGKLISNGLFFSFAPKNERKYFCISALASKKWSNQKIKALYGHIGAINITRFPCSFDLTTYRG